MSAERVAITGVGMVSPVGWTAEASCAAIRAGIVRFHELEGQPLREPDGPAPLDAAGQPLVVVGSRLGELPGEPRGTARLEALLRGALDDLFLDEAAAADPARGAAVLALPSAGAEGISAERFAALVAEATGPAGPYGKAATFPADNAAPMQALEAIWEDLCSCRWDWALLGAVDSLLAPELVRDLHRAGRLHVRHRPTGLIPGEAGCVLRLEPLARARQRGRAVLAIIDAVATAREPDPPTATPAPAEAVAAGLGLSRAMRDALAQAGDTLPAPTLLVADMDGESWRSEELSYARTRVLGNPDSQAVLWHPADCIGATGAAAGAIGIAVAARALARGYAPGPAALITAASPGSLRGAVYTRCVPNGDTPCQ